MPIDIKVCGLREEDNILSLLELEPEYLGFILVEGSKRFIEEGALRKLLKNQEISERAILVLRDMPLKDLENLPLSIVRGVQLHGAETEEYLSKIKKVFPELLIFKALGISGKDSFESCAQFEHFVDYFLFDTKVLTEEGKEVSGGTGKAFDWGLLSSYQSNRPYILSGGLGPENINKILELTKNDSRLVGVDLNSKFELEPGIKNIDLLKQSFKLLRG